MTFLCDKYSLVNQNRMLVEMALTNEDIRSLLTRKQLDDNILEKEGKIREYENGLDVLRGSSMPDDPFVIRQKKFYESSIEDYKEAISTWKAFLEALPVDEDESP